MKVLIWLLLIVLTISSLAQSRIGIINDRDGYTNVREGSNTSSKIVFKLYNYQVFEICASDDPNWYIAKYDNEKTGYIHRSRVREVQVCYCDELTNDKPLYVFKQGEALLKCCASVKRKINATTNEITEAQISNCSTDKRLLNIPATEVAYPEIQPGRVIITRIESLPVGPNWAMLPTPIKTWTIDLYGSTDSVLVEDVLRGPYVTGDESKELVASLTKNPPKNGGDFERVMRKLFVAAISGDQEAESMFRNYKQKFGFALDGYIAEDFTMLKKLLNENKREK